MAGRWRDKNGWKEEKEHQTGTLSDLRQSKHSTLADKWSPFCEKHDSRDPLLRAAKDKRKKDEHTCVTPAHAHPHLRFFFLSSSTFHFEINDERAERGDLRSKRCILRVGVGFGLHAASVASRLNDICTARCADMHLSFHAGRQSRDLQMRGEKEARAYRMRFKSFLNLNIKTTRLFLLPFFMRSTQRSKTFSRYAQSGFFFSDIVHKSA